MCPSDWGFAEQWCWPPRTTDREGSGSRAQKELSKKKHAGQDSKCRMDVSLIKAMRILAIDALFHHAEEMTKGYIFN